MSRPLSRCKLPGTFTTLMEEKMLFVPFEVIVTPPPASPCSCSPAIDRVPVVAAREKVTVPWPVRFGSAAGELLTRARRKRCPQAVKVRSALPPPVALSSPATGRPRPTVCEEPPRHDLLKYVQLKLWYMSFVFIHGNCTVPES